MAKNKKENLLKMKKNYLNSPMKMTYNHVFVLYSELTKGAAADKKATIATMRDVIMVARRMKDELGVIEEVAKQKVADLPEGDQKQKMIQKIVTDIGKEVVDIAFDPLEVKTITAAIKAIPIEKLAKQETTYLCLIDEALEKLTQ